MVEPMSSPHTFVPGFRLRRTEANSDEIDELAERLGGRAGLDVLLADLNRKARGSNWPLGRAVDRAFRWARSDPLTKRRSAERPEGDSVSIRVEAGGRRHVKKNT